MPTVINNPSGGDNSSGLGMIVAVLVIVILAVIFFVYGVPALRGVNNQQPANINVQVPVPGTGDNGGNTGGNTNQ